MSRVEDDRDAARLAARLAEQKRVEENKGKEKSAAASTFSKLVQGQKAAAQQAAYLKQGAQTDEAAHSGRDAIAHLLESMDGKQAEGAHESARGEGKQTASRMGAKTFDERVKQSGTSENDAAARAKGSADQGAAQTSTGRAADQGGAARSGQGRAADAHSTRARLEERKESSDAASAAKGASGGARAEKGDLKADADKGGGQQGGGKDGKGEPAAAQSFRFNPALMAPVAVQQKNLTQGSDKLRKAAAEIAQKIVDKVRVGANAAGRMEFQIDLKGDVLGGMSVKVSAKNGKITAVFSGSDKDVLKLLEEQSDSLKKALSARGLTLEDLKIEARA